MKRAIVLVVIIGFLIWLNRSNENWVTISYAGLIDRSILTHSGETIGEVIQNIPGSPNNYKGLVQPYLEPYSILCSDVLLAILGPDSPPLVNILTHYPIGSKQPAWVDLFREGTFQLYYNTHLIRIFLKGSDPENSFEKHHSIIRHSLQDVISSVGPSINQIEVFVFNNDYANAELQLNTVPYIYKITDLNLSSKLKSIDLTSIENLLEKGITLEAVEVNSNDDLFFYGIETSNQSLAGHPVSLSDVAVIYRSVFHHGENPPYISLDKHEDNRFAKVNFGGHLENTHVGDVVLEADKLFKLLTTGIDPNSHKPVKYKITKHVPTFLTEAERSFLKDGADKTKGIQEIRYWFYPDSIGTETDGSIGTILKYQFLADAERMDLKVNKGFDIKSLPITNEATRETINHLNQNFSQYETAENTFKELSTVGRIMALVIWLKKMNMDDRIELDDLLSVNIPAFTTPKRTKKMLTVNILTAPTDRFLSSRNLRNYTKEYYISHLLDQYDSSTSNEDFLTIAKEFGGRIDITELAPARYVKAESEKNYYERLLRSSEPKIKSLETEIKLKGNVLNNYDSRAVDRYNNLVNRYNQLLAIHESHRNNYNLKVKELNAMKILQKSIVSIGGGINLHPSQFREISRNRNSSKIQEINKIKNNIKRTGGIGKSGNWVRNIPSVGESRINKLSVVSWKSSESVNGKSVYRSQSNSADADVAILTSSPNSKEWQSEISVNGSRDMVTYSSNEKLLKVKHSGSSNLFIGKVSGDGKKFVFHK